MKAQSILIDALTGAITLPPEGIIARHDTTLHLRLAFSTTAIIGPIASYTTDSLRLGLKEQNAPNATTSLIGPGTWTITGTGTTTRYELEVLIDSDTLRTSLGTELQKTYIAQIAWAITTDDNEVKTPLFEVTVQNSATRSADTAPDITEAGTWAWLKARIQAGLGLSRDLNEGSQTLTLNVTGGLFGRLATDITGFNAADTTVFTVALEANTTYRLEVSPIFFMSLSGGTAKTVKMWGTLPSGATAHGRWASTTTQGDQEQSGVYPFTTDAGILLSFAATGPEDDYMPQLQSFIIITSATAGNMLIKARSNHALVAVTAGTHYVLTKLA